MEIKEKLLEQTFFQEIFHYHCRLFDKFLKEKHQYYLFLQ